MMVAERLYQKRLVFAMTLLRSAARPPSLQGVHGTGSLAPVLRPGQVVVMDDLSTHKGKRVGDRTERRRAQRPAALPSRPRPPRRSSLEEISAKDQSPTPGRPRGRDSCDASCTCLPDAHGFYEIRCPIGHRTNPYEPDWCASANGAFGCIMRGREQ